MKIGLATLLLIALCLQIVRTQKEQGRAITPQVSSVILELLKKSYIINGQSFWKNGDFIQKNLQNIYPNSWNVVITTACPYPWTNLTSSNYSMDGQWWIKWCGVNPYLKDWGYSLQRLSQKYQAQDNYNTSSLMFNRTGEGFSLNQRSIINNIMNSKESILKMKELLNEYVYKGNWNLYSVTITDSYFRFNFNVHALGKRWFEYCYADKCSSACSFMGTPPCEYYFGFVS